MTELNQHQVTAVVERCRENIARNGHMVATIAAERGKPGYAYTIGLYPVAGFEFAISGLPVDDMKNALDALARRVREARLRPVDGLMIEDVFRHGYMPRLRPVAPGWPFGWIKDVYELEELPPVWQAQQPDRNHRHPGDPGYDPTDVLDQIDFTVPPRAGQC